MMEVAKSNSDFLWLGNWPAIDFVNTEIVGAEGRRDLLTSGGDLVEWLDKSGLVRRARIPSEISGTGLEAARELRKLLRNGLDDLVGDGRLRRPVLNAVNRCLQGDTLAFVLERRADQFRLRPEWLLRKPEDLCAPIALSYAKLLAEGDPARIRRCGNPSCILYFYDTSKSGTRSWCSLSLCGNRLRAAAFRQRQS
jgi:predicted RNA-binding Zn ribbon-like protein